MRTKIRWGIFGPGAIAHSFAEGLKFVTDAELVAVGSRDLTRAKDFAKKYQIPKAFGSYEELASCNEVDVIYIATPHGRHYEDMLLCLEYNKHILCEKSFTINAKQALKIFQLAREKRLFVMEAMWTRFQPAIFKVKELLARKVIGNVIMMTADLGFNFPFNAEHRLFNPHLGGGALLDLGVYPISLCQYFMGIPDELTTLARIGQTNVDEICSMTFKYQNGRMANLFATLRSHSPSEVIFMGTDGILKLNAPIYRPSGITIQRSDGRQEFFEAELIGNGYNYQAEEVIRCLKTGRLESDIIPQEDTLSVMELMDSIRAQWGLRYPME